MWGRGQWGVCWRGFWLKGNRRSGSWIRIRSAGAKIKEEGIKVEGIGGNWQAKVNSASDAKEIGAQDLVIVAVKAYDTKEAIANIKPLLKEDTFILTLQNGLGILRLSRKSMARIAFWEE